MARECKTVTIYDIAETTHLSAATVSRVLNGKDNISEDTRKRVLSAAKKLNYSPNRAARSLKTKMTKQIALSIPHLRSAFYFELIESVQQIATENNYSLLLNHTHASEQKEFKMLENIRENHVDGLILISINVTERHLREFERIDCPIVLSSIGMNNISVESEEPFDYVGVDTGAGMFMSTEHLIKQGHVNIGYIGLPLETQTGSERFAGYKRAMEKYGLKINPKTVVVGGYSVNFGYNAGKTILSGPKNERPTAIATTCDHICLGLYMFCDEYNIRIPQDVALVGMDNIETSAIIKPKLSTVSIASAEIGRKAGELLFKRISGWDAPKQDVIFEPRLIVRESSVNIK